MHVAAIFGGITANHRADRRIVGPNKGPRSVSVSITTVL